MSSSLPAVPFPKQRRSKNKKSFAKARFVLQKTWYAPCLLLCSILLPLFLILTIIRPLAYPNLSATSSLHASDQQPYIDPCTNAEPHELVHFDPSSRASKHYANPVRFDVDPPSFNRVFTTFFQIYLFQPNSDVVVNLNSTARGRPTDIRNGLTNAQIALRRYYNDDSLTVLNYSLGYEHLDRVRGSRYIFHLNVANRTARDLHHVVAIQRTFDGTCYISVRHYPPAVFESPVHVVLPYANRPKRLAWFLDQFEFLISSNVNVQLLISVCKHNATDVNNVREVVARTSIPSHITVIESAGDQTNFFSRAIAIREAVKHVPTNGIMFISDVDMYIFPTLFDSCRYNVVQGSQVYFPVFYSLYARNDRISKSGGYWRDSSLGMSCMYRSDFDAIGAYSNAETAFLGWGMEDRALSEAFKKDNRYEVFRAVEPALRHKWHLKHCEPLTSAYEDCLSVTFQQLGDMKSVGRFLLENHFDTQKFFAKFVDDDEDDTDAAIVVKDDVTNSTDPKEAGRRLLRRKVLKNNQELARRRILEREKQREIEWRKKTGITKEMDDEAFKEKQPAGFNDDDDGDLEKKEIARDRELIKKEQEKAAAAERRTQNVNER